MKINELLTLKPYEQDTEAKTNIILNAGLFMKRVKDNLPDDDAVKEFGQFLVKRCCIVAVSTPTQEAAFRIFSVMNNRGMDLLVTDILKADIIGQIPGDNEQEQYTRIWEDAENDLGRSGFSDLFNAIRMIFIRTKAKAALSDEFRMKIIPRYSAEKFIDDVLVPYAEAYAFVKDGGKNEYLSWLNLIDNSDWIPPAMQFYVKNKNDSSALNEFFRKLERLAACMFALSYDVNERIERYAKVLEDIDSGSGTNIELSDGEKSDFIQVLDSEIYLMQKKRKYFILRLDSFLSQGGASYKKNKFSLEHILPQTVNPGSEWANTWPDDDTRKKWLHRVGNLIPLERSLNSSASNYDFSRKKDSYFFKKGVTSYILANEIRGFNEWTPKTAEERQKRLISIYASKWQLQ